MNDPLYPEEGKRNKRPHEANVSHVVHGQLAGIAAAGGFKVIVMKFHYWGERMVVSTVDLEVIRRMRSFPACVFSYGDDNLYFVPASMDARYSKLTFNYVLEEAVPQNYPPIFDDRKIVISFADGPALAGHELRAKVDTREWYKPLTEVKLNASLKWVAHVTLATHDRKSSRTMDKETGVKTTRFTRSDRAISVMSIGGDLHISYGEIVRNYPGVAEPIRMVKALIEDTWNYMFPPSSRALSSLHAVNSGLEVDVLFSVVEEIEQVPEVPPIEVLEPLQALSMSPVASAPKPTTCVVAEPLMPVEVAEVAVVAPMKPHVRKGRSAFRDRGSESGGRPGPFFSPRPRPDA